MRDLTNPKTVKRLETESRVRDKEYGQVVFQMMNSIQGRDFMWTLLTECYVFAPVFSTNSMQMAFNEGRRNVGLRMLSDIMRYCPSLYTLMASEANGRGSTSERRDSADGNGSIEGSDLNSDTGTDDDSGPVEDRSINYEAEHRSIAAALAAERET